MSLCKNMELQYLLMFAIISMILALWCHDVITLYVDIFENAQRMKLI